MSVVLFLGLIVAIMGVFDLLALVFGDDSRPDYGAGHTVLMA